MQLRIISQFCYTVNAIFPVSAFFMQIFLFTQGGMAARKGRAPRSPQNPGAAAAVRPTLQSSAAFSAATGDCAAKGVCSQQAAGMQIGRRVCCHGSACPRQKATLVRMRGGRAAEQTEAWRRIAKVTRYKGGSPPAAFVPFSYPALARTKQSIFSQRHDACSAKRFHTHHFFM